MGSDNYGYRNVAAEGNYNIRANLADEFFGFKNGRDGSRNRQNSFQNVFAAKFATIEIVKRNF